MQNHEFIVNYETVSDEFVETVAALDSLNTISTSILEGTYTLQEEDYPNEGLAFLPNMDESEIEESLSQIVLYQFIDIQKGDRFYITYNQFTEEPTDTDTSDPVVPVEDFITLFDNDTTNGWEIVDIAGDIPEAVWVPSDQFDNIQASGFSGSANPNEDWLVSPSIDLAPFVNPVAQIEQRIAFASGDELDLLEILISQNYTGDVETTAWDNLSFENVPDGNGGDFVLSDPLSLENYTDSEVNIAFRYRSTADVSPQWRVSRFEIVDEEEDTSVIIVDDNAEFIELNKALVYNDGEFEEFDAYRLTTEDYDRMGEEDGPGRFDNFSNSLLPENFIPQLLESLPQYDFAQVDDIVFVGYDFFSGGTSSLFPAWINSEEGWIEYNADNFLGDEIIETSSTFVYQNQFITDSGEEVFNTYVLKTATPYIMVDEDYDLIVDALEGVEGFENQVDNLDFFGNFNRNGGDTNWSDAQLEQALAIVLEERFPDASEGDQFEISYDFFRGGSSSESRVFELTADGEFNSPSLSE